MTLFFLQFLVMLGILSLYGRLNFFFSKLPSTATSFQPGNSQLQSSETFIPHAMCCKLLMPTLAVRTSAELGMICFLPYFHNRQVRVTYRHAFLQAAFPHSPEELLCSHCTPPLSELKDIPNKVHPFQLCLRQNCRFNAEVAVYNKINSFNCYCCISYLRSQTKDKILVFALKIKFHPKAIL